MRVADRAPRSDRLGALDLGTLKVRDLPIVLPAPAILPPPQPPVSPAFAVGHGTLLWMDGTKLRITDLETGLVTDGRLGVSDPRGVRGDALPRGGFLVWTQDGAYRLE